MGLVELVGLVGKGRSLRIIAGSLKGRRLKPPSWDGLRPTSDRLRETLFNILAPRIAGARVLDAYAGTGALGLEALSRGARSVTFIEQDRRAQALIAENLAHCGVENAYVIIRSPVAHAFETLRGSPTSEPFDLVLLDPPYESEGRRADDPGAMLAAAGDLLAPGGLLVLEHARRGPVVESAGRLMRSRDVISGDSVLTFYEVSF